MASGTACAGGTPERGLPIGKPRAHQRKWLAGTFRVHHDRRSQKPLAASPRSGNVEKTKSAPVTVIIAWDTEFHNNLPKLFPQADMRAYFTGNQALIEETAFRNGSLQGAYFILAARALGLDCGPMSGFDSAKVNAEFFPEGKWRVNFLCNLGYGDKTKLFPRNPRLDFEQACLVI